MALVMIGSAASADEIFLTPRGVAAHRGGRFICREPNRPQAIEIINYH
jgi:hypothetical protein